MQKLKLFINIVQSASEDRIISVHDPEMHHGRKNASHRFDGYKAAIAVDAESQVFADVDALFAYISETKICIIG
jgi:hypothetical protein